MPKNRKTNFVWVSIAGADAEPAELIETDGRKGILTIGCQDPFWLDDKTAGIIVYDGDSLIRPNNPETQEQRDLRERIYQAKKTAVNRAYEWHRDHAKHGPDCEAAGCSGREKEYTHGWRGPR
jgi:hypothetical protein